MQLVTDLPHEILQDIFLHVASYTSGPHPNPRFELSKWQSFTPVSTVPHTPSYRSAASPYSISHVCRQWRDIALNYPHLWTHLRVMKPRNGVIVHILKEWIDRAGSLPLDLSLFQGASRSSENWSTAKEVLSLFLRSIHRCVSLIIHLNPTIEESFEYLTTLDVQKPTLLETVGVFLYGIWDRRVTPVGSPLANLVLCSSKIRWIAWTSVRELNIEDNVVQFWENLTVSDNVLQCWENLTVLDIDNYQDGRKLVHILSHCHNLEVFIASFPIGDPEDTQGLSPVTLTRLMKLSVAIQHGCRKIFKWLTVPALVELNIDVKVSAEWELVADMLERSRASLRVLNVSGDDVDEDAFLPILRRPCFVELKELRMADSDFHNTLRFLASSKSLGSNGGGKRESSYMPHLEKIVLERIGGEDEEESFIVFSGLAEEMAKSRLGTCDLEVVQQYLDVDLSDHRLSLTIPPVLQ